MIGKRFNRWTVVGCAGRIKTRLSWNVVCDCGTKRIVGGYCLQNNLSRSCGCLVSELTGQLYKTNMTHGKTRAPGYRIWVTMIRRCTNSSDKSYHRYGGRGITVCDRWKDVTLFLSDIGVRPTSQHQIDRIDNNGNYEPSNCKWSTRTEQANNRISNRRIVVNGESKTVAQWSRILGVNSHYIKTRSKSTGLSYEDVVLSKLASCDSQKAQDALKFTGERVEMGEK